MNTFLDTTSNTIEMIATAFLEFLVFLFPFLPASITESQVGIMLFIGFTGQAFFGSRFLIQWLYSEKLGKSVIPLSFWYCSIIGGSTLLIYALWRKDPVIICGQGIGLLIYLRNLYLVHKEDLIRN